MARKLKKEFFAAGNNKLFKNNDKPDQQTFEDLLDSSTFPTEINDRAKRTEAGLVKTTTDVKINAGNDADDQGVSPCGFPTFAKPSQIPNILAGTCIDLQRVNRTTGTVPNSYSIQLSIADCSPNGLYVMNIVGIEPTLIQEFKTGIAPTLVVTGYTNNGGIIAFGLTQVPLLLNWTVEITMQSGVVYTITFTLTQTDPALCDGVLSNIAIQAPPYNPDVNTEDGSNTEDWRISVDRECLDIPECLKDIDYCEAGTEVHSVTYDNDPCDPIDPCNAIVNQVALNSGDDMATVFKNMLTEYNKSADTIKKLSDYVCTLQTQVNNVLAGGAGGSVDLGDMIMTFIPPGNWSASYLEANGQNLLVADYPELYAIIANTYGGSPGVNFNLPDIDGQMFMGTTALAQAGAIIGTSSNGLTDYPLTQANIPAHTHDWGGSTDNAIINLDHAHNIVTYEEQPPIDGAAPHDDSSIVAAAGDTVSEWQVGTLNAQTSDTSASGGLDADHSHTIASAPTTSWGTVSVTPIPLEPLNKKVYIKMRVK